MNIFHKTQKKETRRLPMTGKVKKGFRYYCMAVLSLTAVFAMSTTAFAAGDPLTVVNNLSDFIFGFIRAIGLILLGFGIVQVGLSLKSHDPSQRQTVSDAWPADSLFVLRKKSSLCTGYLYERRSAS